MVDVDDQQAKLPAIASQVLETSGQCGIEQAAIRQTRQLVGQGVTSGAGDIGIERSSGDTELNSGSGDVTILDAVGRLRIHTGAGDVNASFSEGTIEVRSGMGDIIVRVPTGVAVWQDLTTGMGDVRSRIPSYGEPEPGEPFLSVTARSGAGDVTLTN